MDRSIEPHETWTTLGRHMLLVTSVDQVLSSTGDLAAATSAGCGLPGKANAYQELGSTSRTDCGGVYRSRFHIDYLAQMSVIVESTLDSSKRPCWDRFGIAVSENDYQTCVGDGVTSGLLQLFTELHSLPNVDAVVVPGIATGVGQLSKAGFYSRFLSELLNQLPQDRPLPSTIYLAVRLFDPQHRWQETKVALSSAIATAVIQWDEEIEHATRDSRHTSVA